MSTYEHPQGVGPLVAWAIFTLLIPVVGLVAGIVYLFRNRIGPGLALLAEAIIVLGVYAVLVAGASAQITISDLHNVRPARDPQLAHETRLAVKFWRDRGLATCPEGIGILVARFPGLQVDGGLGCKTYYDDYWIGSERAIEAAGRYSIENGALAECAIVAHETGHALGLDHTETGVMASAPEPPFYCRAYARYRELATAHRCTPVRRVVSQHGLGEWRATSGRTRPC